MGMIRIIQSLIFDHRICHTRPAKRQPMTTSPQIITRPESEADIARLLAPRPADSLFDEAVAVLPHHCFIDFLDRHFSYAEVAKLVARAARGLQDLDVKKGDRVGLLLPNTPHYIILYLAALKIGATVVNFNPLYAEREIAQQMQDSGVRVMATLDHPALFEKFEKARTGTELRAVIFCQLGEMLPGWKSLLRGVLDAKSAVSMPRDDVYMSFGRLLDNDGAYQRAVIDPVEDVAVLQYTGGTTGVPKGAMLSHANLAANALQGRGIFPTLEMGAVRMMGVLPLTHVFALTVVLNVTTAMMGTIILLPRFEVMDLIRHIHNKRPTLFPAVPSIFAAINQSKSAQEYDLSSIDYCISGGAPLPVEVKRTFERLTGCVVAEGYGLTECSAVATCNPIGAPQKEGTIGLPMIGTTLDIVSLEDETSALGAGEMGEVCIRGPQVMMGYWNRPLDTAGVLEKMPDGARRLHTGDVGVRDEDGYIRIVDRIKDMIMMGGMKIYPRHVEEAIYTHPAVEECVVAGVDSATRGQIVKAYVRLRPGAALTGLELRGFLKDRLGAHEIPKQVEFRDSLPKTAIGKLSRRYLIEEEARRAAPAVKVA